jgi:hypothetical protein
MRRQISQEFVRKNDTCQLGTHLERELSAPQVLTLESEAAALRADNATLREQLALRDHALNATSTFFCDYPIYGSATPHRLLQQGGGGTARL